MSVKAYDLLQQGIARLNDAGITDVEYDCRVLMESVCHVSRMDLLLEPSLQIEDRLADEFLQYIERRAAHEPLQYLLGEWEFMGLPFCVNPSVLIPRQDTECLIEWILESESTYSRTINRRNSNLKDENSFHTLDLLDVCTGSGCIAISLDLLLPQKIGFSVNVDALDVSSNALKTARENNIINGANVSFYESDMFSQIEGQYDIIVSNPPYIPTKVVDGLMKEVVCHEPRIALDGMEDGLHFYRILAREGKKYLKEGGRLYLEIGHDQGKSVPELLLKEGFTEVEVRKDLACNDRCVRAVFPGE